MRNNQFLGIIAFFIFLTGCARPEVPEYLGIENMRISQLGVQQTSIKGDLKFFNPNHFDLQLKHVDLDVYINEKLTNHYQLDSTIDIKRQDNFYIPVYAKIDLQSLMGDVLQLLFKREVKVRLDGNARLKKNGIAFNLPLRYEGVQNLDSLLQLPR